jgi:hypothetical protein
LTKLEERCVGFNLTTLFLASAKKPIGAKAGGVVMTGVLSECAVGFKGVSATIALG